MWGVDCNLHCAVVVYVVVVSGVLVRATCMCTCSVCVHADGGGHVVHCTVHTYVVVQMLNI